MSPVQKFQFVTLTVSDTKPTAKDPADRRLVRVKAARAARSQNSIGVSTQHQKQSVAARAASQRGAMNRFRSRAASATTGSSPTVDSPFPLDDRLSAWGPVVSPLGHQAWNLLHYYSYTFRARSWAINAKRDWFAFIIEDPAATHATLSFVALNRDLEEGTTISAWTLNHRYKALKLVRHELAKRQTLPPQNPLIGAVALLAITEGLEGHATSSFAHVQALSKLIQLRGGVGQLQNNEALSRLVAWADMCRVSAFSSGPRLPNLFDRTDVAFDQFESGPQYRSSYKFLRAARNFLPRSVYEVMRLLGAVPNYAPSDDVTSRERRNVSRLIYHINTSLLSIHYDDTTTSDNGPAGKLATILCYAAHLYISLVLRQMPQRTKVVFKRAFRLDKALRECEAVTVWDKSMVELYLTATLWAHTLLFCSRVPAAQVLHPNSELKKLLSTLAITNLKQFVQHLSKISWIGMSFDNELARIITQS